MLCRKGSAEELGQVGVRKDLVRKLPHFNLNTRKKPVIQRLEKFSSYQKQLKVEGSHRGRSKGARVKCKVTGAGWGQQGSFCKPLGQTEDLGFSPSA